MNIVPPAIIELATPLFKINAREIPLTILFFWQRIGFKSLISRTGCHVTIRSLGTFSL